MELSAAEPRALVAIRNAGAAPVRLEVKVQAWGQGPGGEMELAATSEVVVYPPILALEPGAARNLRVGALAAPGPAERSWRIFVEELPPPDRPGEPGQVRVLSRIGIPVFLAPARPAVRAEVTGLALEKGRATFALRNSGTVRVRPSRVRLEGRGPDGRAIVEKDLDCWYVLAGGERRFEVPLPDPDCGRVASLAVEVALDRDRPPLVARAEVGGGACGP